MKTYLLIAVCMASIIHAIGTIVSNENLAKQFQNIAFCILSTVSIFILAYMSF